MYDESKLLYSMGYTSSNCEIAHSKSKNNRTETPRGRERVRERVREHNSRIEVVQLLFSCIIQCAHRIYFLFSIHPDTLVIMQSQTDFPVFNDVRNHNKLNYLLLI